MGRHREKLIAYTDGSFGSSQCALFGFVQPRSMDCLRAVMGQGHHEGTITFAELLCIGKA